MARYKVKWSEHLVFYVDADSESGAIRKSEDVIYKEGDDNPHNHVDCVGFQILKAKREV